jgi:iron-sulfur cluster assembly accessory protein
MTEKSLNLLEIDDIDDAPVSFTPEAVNAVKDALFAEESEPEVGLRVGVRGGGCAGYSYVLDFTKVKENDLVMNFNDFTVYMDPISATHLEGTIIDYVTSLMGMGFKFINPNAQKTCGCGSSFS